MTKTSAISSKSNSQTRAVPVFGKKDPSCFFKPFIQPKLTINQADDQYEREADAVAEKVMRMPDTKTQSLFFQPKTLLVTQLQKSCDNCEEEEKLQRKEEENAGEGMAATSVIHDVLNSPGQPLDEETRNFMESRFGYDFGNVQIHNDASAHQSSEEINALAYTHENHIVFSNNNYQPDTNSGKQLLAHELAHVVQQGEGIRTYRNKKAFNFGKDDSPPGLVEDSFNVKKDKETKPWIELITITMDKQSPDVNNFDTWSGKAEVKYYNNGAKLPDFTFTVMAGSEDLGMTTAGDFTLKRIEGVGYNSGKYSGKVDKTKREGPKKSYSKDLSANMSYAVFFHGGEALHAGPLDFSSHGCVHVDYSDIKQVNYHSVIGLTKVKIKYP